MANTPTPVQSNWESIYTAYKSKHNTLLLQLDTYKDTNSIQNQTIRRDILIVENMINQHIKFGQSNASLMDVALTKSSLPYKQDSIGGMMYNNFDFVAIPDVSVPASARSVWAADMAIQFGETIKSVSDTYYEMTHSQASIEMQRATGSMIAIKGAVLELYFGWNRI